MTIDYEAAFKEGVQEERARRYAQERKAIDNAEMRAQGMALAILHRIDAATYGKEFAAHATARDYAEMSLIETARMCLEENHDLSTRGLSAFEVATEALFARAGSAVWTREGGAHSTSDFPSVLNNVANKLLRQGYQASPQTFRSITKVKTVKDFKEIATTQLGEAPQLQKVGEGGEFTRGTMGEAVEKYTLATYGKIVSFSRRALVNDDLDAFARLPLAFGAQASNLESDAVWYQVLKNANMGDGVALFAAGHNNIGTGAIAAVGISSGRLAMNIQKGLDGTTYLNLTPAFLIVPEALLGTAEQYRGLLYPADANAVPDSMVKLGIISEPRLDLGVTFDGDLAAGSAAQWYLAARPLQVDVLELAYLAGQVGPFTTMRTSFNDDGLEIKCRLDAAAKAIDFRGLYRSSGV